MTKSLSHGGAIAEVLLSECCHRSLLERRASIQVLLEHIETSSCIGRAIDGENGIIDGLDHIGQFRVGEEGPSWGNGGKGGERSR